jgi:hypothetical protein
MVVRSKKSIRVPHAFVLDALAPLQAEVGRLFSGFAVYSGDRLLMVLRESEKSPRDNGVWLVLAEGTDPSDKSLRRDFPSLRQIDLLHGKMRHWLLLPSDDAAFETLALHACDLMVRRDPRFGRVPVSRRI